MYEFRLHTSQASFERWLEIAAVGWTETRGPGRTCAFQRISAGRQPGQWVIDAFLVSAGAADESDEARYLERCITFDLLALSDTRLRVQAQCHGLGAGYLADLVERIRRDYPEAATPETAAGDVRETPAGEAAPDPGAGADASSQIPEHPERRKKRDLAIKLRRDGRTIEEVAEEVEMSVSGVKRWLDEAKLVKHKEPRKSRG